MTLLVVPGRAAAASYEHAHVKQSLISFTPVRQTSMQNNSAKHNPAYLWAGKAHKWI